MSTQVELKVCVQVGFEFVCVYHTTTTNTTTALCVRVCVYDYLRFVCGLPSKHILNWETKHIESYATLRYITCVCIYIYVCMHEYVCVCVCVCIIELHLRR